MATENIARPSTPSNGTKHPPDPATLLEEKSVQLHSLLCYCYGTGTPTQDDAGPVHRNNVFWLAAQLAEEVMELVQVCVPRGS